VVSVTPRPRFTPGERTPVPIGKEAGWAPEPVWTQRIEEKYFAPVEDRTSITGCLLAIINRTPAFLKFKMAARLSRVLYLKLELLS
jgi:hypothetical protein